MSLVYPTKAIPQPIDFALFWGFADDYQGAIYCILITYDALYETYTPENCN